MFNYDDDDEENNNVTYPTLLPNRDAGIIQRETEKWIINLIINEINFQN